MKDDDGSVREIIIVKRKRSASNDEHHGGVWKIAFADFMTAMMAFFLVLWIVNSTSKETQAAIARYFNPVKLTDTTPAPRGVKAPRSSDYDSSLKDETKEMSRSGRVNIPKNDTQRESRSGESADGESLLNKVQEVAGQHCEMADQKKITESCLFSDPTRVLAEIRSRYDVSGLGEQAEAARNSGSRINSTVFTDPFASVIIGVVPDKVVPLSASSTSSEASANRIHEASTSKTESDRAISDENELAEKLRTEIASLRLTDRSPDDSPLTSVQVVKDQITIALRDSDRSSMFAIGSAVPSASAVRFIERIGEVIRKLDGKIVVRGHTDGRSFKTDPFGNWRLSASRAIVAVMVLQGVGIDRDRFVAIDGRGDREPLIANEPLAAENRRIEILAKRSVSD